MISLIFAFNFFIGFVGFYTLLWYFLADHKFKGPNFVFRAEELHDISKLGIGKSSKEEMFETVHQELLKRFPNHVWKQRKWIFFNAGGWMGHLCVLHASLTEYVILFGSPLPTSGHSGRYPLEVFDFVMEGEYHNQYELTIDSHSYKPGDASYLPCMKSCTFCIKDHAWMLEYGRRLLPLSLPFQSVGSLFTTLDYISMFRLQMTFAKYLLYELIFNQKI